MNTIQCLLIVTTQHGYVVIFDIASEEIIICNKVHCGSIEGCTVDRSTGYFATVGGDCAAFLWNLKL